MIPSFKGFDLVHCRNQRFISIQFSQNVHSLVFKLISVERSRWGLAQCCVRWVLTCCVLSCGLRLCRIRWNSCLHSWFTDQFAGFLQNHLLRLMNVQGSDQHWVTYHSSNLVLVDLRQNRLSGYNLTVSRSWWIKSGVKQKDGRIVLNFSPVNISVLPRISDKAPVSNNILFSLDNIIYNKPFGVELLFVKFVQQKESLGILVLSDLNCYQSCGTAIKVLCLGKWD